MMSINLFFWTTGNTDTDISIKVRIICFLLSSKHISNDDNDDDGDDDDDEGNDLKQTQETLI